MLKKIFVKISACFIKDKEKRRLYRKNLLRTEAYHLPGRTYIMKPYFGPVKDLKIGKFCSIARNVTIAPGNHPYTFLSTAPCLYKSATEEKSFEKYLQEVVIGNDVWIGTNVTILNGIHIPDGCVVAAGAVVTSSPPPYSIVGGVPAKVIKFRFEQPIIEKLLESKWWDLPLEEIQALPFKDVEECLKILNDKKNTQVIK